MTTLPDIPTAVMTGTPTTKVLYFWLRDAGQVTMSIRDIADSLGMNDKNMYEAYDLLKESGLLNEVEAAKGNQPATFEIREQKKD